MTIRVDPDHNEVNALFELVDLSGRNVLEIGCGDGRLTWRYAHTARHVTAIDSWEEGIKKAKENMPRELQDRVEFQRSAFLDHAGNVPSSFFDTVILSWSL